MTFDDILTALPSLDRAELRRIAAVTSSLLGTEQGEGGVADDVAFTYGLIEEVLSNHKLRLPALSYFLNSSEFKRTKFKLGARTFVAFLEEFRPKSQAEKRAAGLICLEAVEQCLDEQKLPIRLRTIAQWLPNVAVYVERQFPGYIESGMLPVIVQRLARRGKT